MNLFGQKFSFKKQKYFADYETKMMFKRDGNELRVQRLLKEEDKDYKRVVTNL